jgi:hypothetical protein
MTEILLFNTVQHNGNYIYHLFVRLKINFCICPHEVFDSYFELTQLVDKKNYVTFIRREISESCCRRYLMLKVSK